jgi:integrase
MRRIALDSETVALLTEHKRRCAERLRLLGGELTEDMYVFSNSRTFDPERPCSPHSVSSRYRNLARRLEIDTHIHALRHYSATELLTAGIDLRTVAGRLGHGRGGATTLRACMQRGSRRPIARQPRSWARACRSVRPRGTSRATASTLNDIDGRPR